MDAIDAGEAQPRSSSQTTCVVMLPSSEGQHCKWLFGRGMQRFQQKRREFDMLRFAAGILGSVVVAGSALAFGSDDHWSSGFGQGVAEAIVTKGPGNNIYVTCDSGADRGSTGISFSLAGRAATGSRILLTFDGEDPQEYSLWDGSIPSNCRACASVYDHVIERLKRHSSVHVRFENGDAARFTLKGSSKAIGQCVADFYR